MKVDEYIVKVFDFAQMLLAYDGAISLFHSNDLKFLKEVKFYLECYGFQIWMKWVTENSLPLTSSEDPFFKVPPESIKLYLYIFSFQLCLKYVFNFVDFL